MAGDIVNEWLVRSRRWSGLHVWVRDLNWREPRGGFLCAPSAASLHVVLDEIGGRAEFRRDIAKAKCSEHYGFRSMAFLPAGTSVHLFADDVQQVRLATFEFAEPLEMHGAARPRIGFRDERLYACAGLLARETLGDQEPQAYGASLARALVEALSRALATDVEVAPAMSRKAFDAVAKYVSDHLDETIPLNALATVSGLVPANFTRAFATATGETPQRWQMEERIRWAQRLMLGKPTPSFKEIALWTGFSDQSHFSRTFAQIVGMAPRSWLRERN